MRTAVPAIDLAALLRVQLPEDGRTLSYLKLDVEGAEFELLPWLLLQGCRLRSPGPCLSGLLGLLRQQRTRVCDSYLVILLVRIRAFEGLRG